MQGQSVPPWKEFEDRVRRYFSDIWGVDLQRRSVVIEGAVRKSFDMVSDDQRYVGDAKWLKSLKTPAAKWQGIAEYIWLLQKVPAERKLLVFGQHADVAERYLLRFRPLIEPVEFYFFDGTSHRLL
jgi:hypothetical protein